MSILNRIQWSCGCCASPPLDFAELATSTGMVSITTEHDDRVDSYTVRRYGPSAQLASEETVPGDELEAQLQAMSLVGDQPYLAS